MDIASSCSAPMAAISASPQTLIDEVGRMDSVTSVQVTFHEDWSPERHSMPPGGFRLAIVNCFDLARGRQPARGLSSFFYLMRRMARVSGTAKHTGGGPPRRQMNRDRGSIDKIRLPWSGRANYTEFYWVRCAASLMTL